MGVRGESVGLGRGQPDPLGVTGVVSASLSDGERVVVAVDPGRAKCGVACVAESGSVIERAVLGLDEVVEWVGRACEGREALVVVGDGTGHAAVEQQLAVAHIAWVRVCERDTSMLARKRYLAEHPGRGWRRLIPAGLRTPDEPYDDYVAVILAERVHAQNHLTNARTVC